MARKFGLVFFTIFFVANLCVAQNTSATPSSKEAKDNFSMGNYNAALNEYLNLLNGDPKNPLYNLRAGICYLNTFIDRGKAIDYLKTSLQSKDFEREASFHLGKAYQLDLNFDEAESFFKKYKELSHNGAADEILRADREIEICQNAKDLMKFPLDVTFENLGKNVNSEYPDYYPFVTDDASTLMFTTRRKGTTGGYQIMEGVYTSDIFMSEERNGKWAKAKSAGMNFNTPGEDEITGMTPNGSYVFIYSETEIEFGDIQVVMKKGRSYLPRFPFDGVNTNKIEAAACSTPDGNTVFFSSDRPGGEGDLDLYMVKRLPTGQWAEPLNLGPNVNTKYIEDFPNISADGKTLYFCSEGHVSMGGFDVFRSEWNEENSAWGNAVNIGYPVNTPDDNMTISFPSTDRQAYVSAFRKEGLGDLDVYRVIFNSVEPTYGVIKGFVKTDILLESNFQKANLYKKGSLVREFPEEITPDSSWQFVEMKKELKNPAIEKKYTLIFEKEGKQVMFGAKAFPKNDPSFILKDIKVTEVKKAPPVKPLELKYESKPLAPDQISVYRSDTKDLYGTYKTKNATGSFIMIVPPGNYELEIEVEGFDTYKETFSVEEKSSSAKEIEKVITLKKKG